MKNCLRSTIAKQSATAYDHDHHCSRSFRSGADYRAVAGRRQSVGKTPGEALDAMTAQLSSDEAGALVVIQNLRPDTYFTAEQHRRLNELMTLWREARDRAPAFLKPIELNSTPW